MEFYRVGDKLISHDKLMRAVDRILTLRASGLSQQETAHRLGCDRTLISRLEALAEVRKGGAVAVIGFPLGNKGELQKVCDEYGVEYALLMNEAERYQYVESRSGLELLNEIMGIISRLRDFDTVIMIGSDMRIRLASAIFGDKVIGIQIGQSPIEQDVVLDVSVLADTIGTIRGRDKA